MRRVDTPDGGWVDVRERQDLTFRQSNMMEAAMVAAGPALAKLPEDGTGREMFDLGLTFDEAEAVTRMNEVAVVALVAGWSYPVRLPSTPAEAADLPADVGKAAAHAIASIGARVLDDLRRPTDFSPGPDVPGSPTGPSRASNGSVRAAKASTPARSRKKS